MLKPFEEVYGERKFSSEPKSDINELSLEDLKKEIEYTKEAEEKAQAANDLEEARELASYLSSLLKALESKQ